MDTLNLDPNGTYSDADWVGNNAAFRCPLCTEVFIVSGRLNPHGRQCPTCEGSTAYVQGGRKSGGMAYLEWTAPT